MSSKKTKNVRDPNLGMKMSDFNISVNNAQIRIIFLMEIVLKILIIHLGSFAEKLCFIFSRKISQITINGSDSWSHPKMSGILQNNVRDPRSQDPNFLELCDWLNPFLRSSQPIPTVGYLKVAQAITATCKVCPWNLGREDLSAG